MKEHLVSLRVQLQTGPILGIKRLNKITKHAAAVYPLEAYGLILGSAFPAVLMEALPVGQTTRWYDPFDRFSLIGRATPVAERTAAEFSLSVLGLYHSHCDRIVASPLTAVPDGFANSLVFIKPVWGGEATLLTGTIHFQGSTWRRGQCARMYLPRNRYNNPRRIQAAWTRSWGAVEYRRSYDARANNI